ncbi:beta-N-acetylglucosaminidase domain-containing protein [Coprobacillus cateniformis]|uniref:beta-N-acetylglucosaminidase domain-containing protein n=1 Tax=Coprobacillus cateniformis TaxID=100884 RepID=UPI00266D438B|nr:beta-N-acetylglucosaminidase domain-containing protein [Coprobacillus cateniformis]
MGQFKKKVFAVIASMAMVISLFSHVGSVYAAMPEYEIYPTPHTITYQNSDFILRDKVNVVYEDGIDKYTKSRLKEVTDIKKLSISTSSALIDNSDESVTEKVTNILVGIKGSGGYVDQYVQNNKSVSHDLFDKNDSYYLEVNDGTIIILGKDTNAAFYGLTTLYHVFNQLESRTIRHFTVEDYADVVSRGFIEGYYGNPWSVEDRAELMKFGGYYKMNTYFYAPKDDPKHKDKWDILYTQDEINNLIKPLAKAGNESKCSFAYALHPFGWARTFNFDNYDEELAKLKAKFKQVIDCGVRQIAILADDFHNPGGANGLKLINDISDWLKNDVQKEYPDMKTTLPYIPYDYMGDGSGAEFTELKKAPNNVQLVMTGGGVWGTVNTNFTNTFTNNVGRGPFLWINWPCSDNATNRLIMGGYKEFLNPGVSPDKIQGIMLNPMEHSEPSKVGIFGNACYSWNIWQSANEADQAWTDSFKYVDHNTALDTKSSKSLREISKHMIAQNTGLDESLDLKSQLNSFRSSLTNNTVTVETCDVLIQEFQKLKESAAYYKNSGNKRLREQMAPWLNCWDDTMESGISYLEGIKASLNNDSNAIIEYNTKGSKALADSQKHHFITKNTNDEYALVGSKYITPLIKDMSSYLNKKVEEITDPNYFGQTFITNRTDFPNGSLDNVFDGNDATNIQYTTTSQNEQWIKSGQYVGVEFNKAIEIHDIRFLLGSGKNKFEHSKLQYTTDGTTWTDLDGAIYDFATNISNPAEIKVDGLSLTAKGIRLITTQDNAVDAWLIVSEITINKAEGNPDKEPEKLEITNVELENIVIAPNGGNIANLTDGNENTETFFRNPSGADNIEAGAAIIADLGESKNVGSIAFVQGLSNGADVPSNAIIEYSEDKINWTKLTDLSTEQRQTFNGNGIQMRYIRIQNTANKKIWWRVGEITVYAFDPSNDTTPLSYTVIKTPTWRNGAGGSESNNDSKLYDGDDNTAAYYDPANNGDEGRTNDVSEVGDYIGYDLGKIASLASAHIVVGNGSSDKWTKYHLEYSVDNTNWTTVNTYTSSTQKDVIDENLGGIQARYIRIVNDERITKWLYFSEFTVKEIKSGIKDYVYTNQDNSPILSNYEEDLYSLNGATLTLGVNEYFGIQLPNIRMIESMTSDIALSSNIKLQVSKNSIEWIDCANFELAKLINARYIRIVNTGSSNENITFNQFEVKTFSIKKAGFYDSNIQINAAYGDGDMRRAKNSYNIFDGKLSTSASIAGYPTQDGYVTFDLGQERTISSLRYYIKETDQNYIRDAIFEVSNDPAGSSWTPVLEIGDRVENTGADTDGGSSTTAKTYSELLHDSVNPGNMYKENILANGAKAVGRYLRVRFTAPYKDRFAAFNEIVINNNEYVTTESNHDFTLDAIEEPGKIPSHMLDNDLSTTFKSSQPNSSFIYHVSNPNEMKSIRFVQVGEVSNAKVNAEVYVTTKGRSTTPTTKSITLGTLNQPISEFKLPDGYLFKNVSVTWLDKIPELAEVILMNTAMDTTASKMNLKTLLDNKENTQAWTNSSQEKYEMAYQTAKNIYDNENASVTSIESAISGIQSAIANKLIKYVGTELKDLIKQSVDNDTGVYTAATYQAYYDALSEAKLVVNDADLSIEKATQLIDELKMAKNNLVYSLNQQEIAVLTLSELKSYDENSYSKAGYKAYQEAIKTLQDAITKDQNATTQQERVHPDEIEKLIQTLKTVEEQLADITILKDLIQEFNSYPEKLYIVETFKDYKNAINEGTQLLETGTKTQVESAIQKINVAKSKLTLKPNVNLQEVIEEAKTLNKEHYTTDSYTQLTKAIADASKPHDSAYDYDYAQAILKAKTELVSTVALKNKIKEVQSFDENLYTLTSWKTVKTLLGQTDQLMINGTNQLMAQMINQLNKALLNLQKRATSMDEYRKAIVLKNSNLYTKESYEKYLNAYHYLMSLPLDDTDGQTYIQAKVAFENATIALELIEKTQDSVQTGDNINIPFIGGIMLLAGAYIIFEQKRKYKC